MRRTWILFRARLAMAARAGWAVPTLFFHAALATLLALLVRDSLPGFPYALLALTVGATFLSLPLLSDLGSILRRDEGGEWIAALPARKAERDLARTLHLGALLLVLELSLLVPFSVFAPPALSLATRAALVAAGFALAVTLAGALLWMQRILLERFERALVLLQASLVLVAVVSLLLVLGHLPALARLDGATSGWLRFFPPAWFAAALSAPEAPWWPPALASAIGGASLLVLPVSSSPRVATRRGEVHRALRRIRGWIADRWVRPDERGAFELVSDGLPREREFALRTLPLIGIPLAFLGIGALEARGQGGRGLRDVLALLLFTVGVYLPILLTHVPLTESPGASWILRTAPKSEGAIVAGTIKALFLRYLVPLHLLLASIALFLGAGDLVARLWLPSLLLVWVELLSLYGACVRGLPLSATPDELQADLDWVPRLSGLALGLTVMAVLANRFVTWPVGLALSACLAWVGHRLERRLRTRLG